MKNVRSLTSAAVVILASFLASSVARSQSSCRPESPLQEKIQVPQALSEGVEYSFVVGNSGLYGKAFIKQNGSKFTVRMPVYVFGASLFSLTSYQEATTGIYSNFTEGVRPEYFPNTPDKIKLLKSIYRKYQAKLKVRDGSAHSTMQKMLAEMKSQGVVFIRNFHDHPFLLQRVKDVFKEVEGIYKHPNFELHIEPRFIGKDENTLGEFAYYDLPGNEYDQVPEDQLESDQSQRMAFATYAGTALLEAIKENKRFNSVYLPTVIYSLIFNTKLMSPGGWDIYDPISPGLIAHEFGHIFKIANEVFLKQNYPINGLMTDATALRLLKSQCHLNSQLLRSDFYSLMSGIFEALNRNELATKVVPEEILGLFFERSNESLFTHDVVNASGKGYYEFTGPERIAYKKLKLDKQGDF